MLIDFHTHTTASDGALSPEQLVDRARSRGIRLFAITDHDTVSGYEAAAAYYSPSEGEMSLVAGLEFSCVWSGATIHVVGLGVDCDHPLLRQGVARLLAARYDRGQVIAERLAKLGFPGAMQGALLEAGDSQLGRPHFAGWMVGQGHAKDTGAAFDRYLGRGKPGDVKAFWPELAEVTEWIVAAGGVAVLAHPLKYKLTRSKLQRLVADFKRAGGEAVEVVNGRQTPEQTRQLCRLALECGLEVSIGSDFHRDSPWGPQLGVELRHLGNLRGVWERWLPATRSPGEAL
ncbi:PHP domain-containing protein [Haliea sp. E1-2-M8]|uniref:PHP domain-containing protein n=1 Tax=Haliea sp. E1-2-M8 TaxID=3064706 RepID=UPI00272933A7|nr:PHP domain-containing protein [Haliea sp. E1-2-M8]MDO8862247.1 PHP domain-containing protein [Haliea sp. E1-2-M8]